MSSSPRFGSNRTAELSPPARLAFSLLMMAAGVFPMLAAFDVGPLGRKDINGPPWLGFVAGAVFFVGGVMLLLGERLRNHPLSFVLLFVVLCGFGAIGNWVAFGAGTRACDVGVGGFFTASRGASDLVCRAGFGVGALVLNGMLLAMLARGLARVLGPGPAAVRVESVGKWLLFAALSPILVPMLLVMLVASLFGAVRTYFKTGRWPRNEEFIAKMKLKKSAAAGSVAGGLH